MKRFVSILLSLVIIALSMNAASAQSKAARAFEKLKTLVGEWEGQGPEGSIHVSYELVSGGTALMETRKPASEPDMISIFHLDGERLVMTHYCSAGNQPSMRAELSAGEIENLRFAFVSVANLASPSAGHMRNLAYEFKDRDHFTQIWAWRENGKDSLSTFHLNRKK